MMNTEVDEPDEVKRIKEVYNKIRKQDSHR